jgi:hypothetical protein
MAYIQSAVGQATNPTLKLTVAGKTGLLEVPYLQDVTINNANDVFTWTQLNESAKLQVATTATNSISTNIVVDPTTFFGTGSGNVGSASNLGIIGLSDAKTLINFTINMGNIATGGGGRTLSGEAYVTGLAPTVSADSPVWVTPLTLTVDGPYTVSAAA